MVTIPCKGGLTVTMKARDAIKNVIAQFLLESREGQDRVEPLTDCILYNLGERGFEIVEVDEDE